MGEINDVKEIDDVIKSIQEKLQKKAEQLQIKLSNLVIANNDDDDE